MAPVFLRVRAAGRRHGGGLKWQIPQTTADKGALVRFFGAVERMGQRLPDPLTLFFGMGALVVLVSALFVGASAEVVQRSGDTVQMEVKSLLTLEGIRWMLLSAVDNFINFAPLGPVLTVMIGIGVAERAGFISMGLRVLVTKVPDSLLTATVVFAGVMSSMAADAGYVVLTPLGALLFASVKRHPLAGLAAAYAGVSGGFSANLLITGLDPMLSALTQQAAQSLDPSYTVNPACNYYFMVASTVMLTVMGTLVTTKILEPMLGTWDPSLGDGVADDTETEPGAAEARAFGIAMGVGAIAAVGIALLGIVPGAPLRDVVPEGGPCGECTELIFLGHRNPGHDWVHYTGCGLWRAYQVHYFRQGCRQDDERHHGFHGSLCGLGFRRRSVCSVFQLDQFGSHHRGERGWDP